MPTLKILAAGTLLVETEYQLGARGVGMLKLRPFGGRLGHSQQLARATPCAGIDGKQWYTDGHVRSTGDRSIPTGPIPFFMPFSMNSSAFREPRCGVPKVTSMCVSFPPPRHSMNQRAISPCSVAFEDLTEFVRKSLSARVSNSESALNQRQRQRHTPMRLNQRPGRPEQGIQLRGAIPLVAAISDANSVFGSTTRNARQ